MVRVEGAVEEGELESKRKTVLRITVTKWPYGLLQLQIHVQLHLQLDLQLHKLLQLDSYILKNDQIK